MDLNQAFELLKKSGQNADCGGNAAARIILRHHGRDSIGYCRVRRYARALRRGVPIAKIIHEKWFYGLPFYTNSQTLDPRPDSETLIQAVLNDYSGKSPRILDLGTGTGCLICAAIKNLPDATGIGIDKSYGAVRVAKKNVKKLGLNNRIQIINRSFDDARPISNSMFDVIVSNPPYIAHDDTRVNAAALHDPEIALFAGADGLDAYRTIAQNAKTWLKPNGKIYLEIGADQEKSVQDIFESSGWTFVTSHKDLSGIERALVFTRCAV